jgi:D-methionine transport system substrate-binding protein
MKKIIYLMCIFAVLFCSAGCKKQKAANVLNVGATPEPHAEMLNLIADDLAQEGITLKVIEFTDYVTPNEALESG